MKIQIHRTVYHSTMYVMLFICSFSISNAKMKYKIEKKNHGNFILKISEGHNRRCR